ATASATSAALASAIAIAAASVIAIAVSTVVIARAARHGRATSKTHCQKPRRRNESHGAVSSAGPPALLSPPEDLPVLRGQCPEDRLQGREALAAVCVRARQDRAEPHYGSFRKKAARAGARHQARALSRAVALCDPLANDSTHTTEDESSTADESRRR